MHNPEDRGNLLRRINDMRNRYALPLWESVKRIGKVRSGETEIIDLVQIIDQASSHFIVFVYRVLYPPHEREGEPTPGMMVGRVSTRPPLMVITRVNGRYLLTYSHRPHLGTWTRDIPRGWGDPNAKTETELVRELLERKLGKDFVSTFDSFAPVYLGSNWEDTGALEDEIPYYFLDATTASEIPSQAGPVKIRSFTWDELVQGCQSRELCRDQHSKAALWEYEHSRYFRP